ncbi:hypothetical protein TCAL_02635 [Tigriopus californicus]|uniref:RING-type domain-containing protein n=1 Tax=Tigriopus californicus TaxID=6832 RepID=A0A553NG09_TIGCA|nr:zip homologous protein 4-like [Tigriopus californicus]TRY64386.1 hypothetical protein TCAL_02635 [Tigriopus californicus]
MASSMGEYWIHCNHCLTGSTRQSQIFLSNCGHLYCGPCAKKSDRSQKCLLCSASPIQFLEIGSNLPPHIQNYFHNILNELKSLYQVQEFQKRQQKNLISKLVRKTRQKEQEIRHLQHENKACSKKIEDMKAKMAQLERYNSQIHPSPAPNPTRGCPKPFDFKPHPFQSPNYNFQPFDKVASSALPSHDGRHSLNSSRSGHRKHTPTLMKPGRLTLPRNETPSRELKLNQGGIHTRLGNPVQNFFAQSRHPVSKNVFKAPSRSKDPNMFQKVSGWLNNIQT